MDRHRLAMHGRRRLGVEAHRLVQLRVVRAPQQVAGADARKVDRAVAKGKLQRAVALRRDVIDAAALLRLLRAAPVRGVEDDAVARLERRIGGIRLRHEPDAIRQHARHPAHQHAAVARRAAAHDRLVVGAGNEVRAKPARVDLLQLHFLARRDAERQPRPRLVHRLAVGRRGQRHVVGILVAPLDLERVHADAHDLRHLLQRVEVAGREEVARIAQRLALVVDDQVVGQPARLRALAAVGTAPAPRLGGEALP